jgi:hypothetical protein
MLMVRLGLRYQKLRFLNVLFEKKKKKKKILEKTISLFEKITVWPLKSQVNF